MCQGRCGLDFNACAAPASFGVDISHCASRLENWNTHCTASYLTPCSDDDGSGDNGNPPDPVSNCGDGCQSGEFCVLDRCVAMPEQCLDDGATCGGDTECCSTYTATGGGDCHGGLNTCRCYSGDCSDGVANFAAAWSDNNDGNSDGGDEGAGGASGTGSLECQTPSSDMPQVCSSGQGCTTFGCVDMPVQCLANGQTCNGDTDCCSTYSTNGSGDCRAGIDCRCYSGDSSDGEAQFNAYWSVWQ